MKRTTLFLFSLMILGIKAQTSTYEFKEFKNQPIESQAISFNAAGNYFFKLNFSAISGKNKLSAEYFDGTSWKSMPSAEYKGTVGSFCYWNGNYYLLCNLTEINGITAAAGKTFRTLIWKNNYWDTVAKMEMSNSIQFDQLIVVESGFYGVNELRKDQKNIMKINPNIGSVRNDTITLDTTHKNPYFRISSNANTILFQGNFKKINSIRVNAFFMIQNDQVVLPNFLGTGEIVRAGVDWNNDIYYLRQYGGLQIGKYSNGVNSSIPHSSLSMLGSISPCNGQIFTSPGKQINNKTHNWYKDSAGSSWHLLYAHYWIYSTKNFGFLAWDFDNKKLMSLSAIPAGTVKGKVYADLNKDCNYDTYDSVVRHHPVFFESNTKKLTVLTNLKGEFTQILPIGKYKVTYPHSNLNSLICNVDSVTVDTNTLDTLNFAMYPKDLVDLSIKIISPGTIRLDDARNVMLLVENKGSYKRNALVTLTFNKKLKRKGGANYKLLEAGKIVFELAQIPPLSKVSLSNYFEASFDSFQINNTLRYYARLDTFINEKDTLNNFDSAILKTVYSYDPNYIVCNHEPYADISVRKFKYFVEFQNEGNDYAQNVTVLDSLPIELSLASFQFLESSHPCILQVNNNVLKLVYNNIYLQPKLQNEPKSKGWFVYEIAVPNLPVNTLIKNRAAIYFDRNAPVLTNTSVVKIIQAANTNRITSISTKSNILSLFPNPATRSIAIKNSSSGLKDYSIYTLEGKLIVSSQIRGNTSIVLSTEKLIEGMYILKSENESIKFLVIK